MRTRWDVRATLVTTTTVLSQLTPSRTSPPTLTGCIRWKFQHRLPRLVATVVSQFTSGGAEFASFKEFLHTRLSPRSSSRFRLSRASQATLHLNVYRKGLIQSTLDLPTLSTSSLVTKSTATNNMGLFHRANWKNGKTHSGANLTQHEQSGPPDLRPILFIGV